MGTKKAATCGRGGLQPRIPPGCQARIPVLQGRAHCRALKSAVSSLPHLAAESSQRRCTCCLVCPIDLSNEQPLNRLVALPAGQLPLPIRINQYRERKLSIQKLGKAAPGVNSPIQRRADEVSQRMQSGLVSPPNTIVEHKASCCHKRAKPSGCRIWCRCCLKPSFRIDLSQRLRRNATGQFPALCTIAHLKSPPDGEHIATAKAARARAGAAPQRQLSSEGSAPGLLSPTGTAPRRNRATSRNSRLIG